MNGKIVKLEYISPKCAVCGRDLPKDRRRKCYACLPPRGFRCAKKDPAAKAEYTMADREAQARSYGLSYGQFIPYIENGWKLPTQIRPIQWPLGSAHFGEDK